MSAFMIKLLAVILMIVDHVGYFLFPDILVLRVIGRLSFPLFAFLIANGFQYTKDRHKYFLRLFIFANIIQLPSLFITLPVNIFYTLSFGLLCIMIWESPFQKAGKYITIIGVALLADIIGADYGTYGVLLILIVHLFRNKYMYMSLAILGLTLLIPEIVFDSFRIMPRYSIYSIQTFAALTPGIMYFYNNKKGRSMKYFFYLFYPIHMVFLDWLSHYF